MREINIRGHKFQVTEDQNAFWDNVEAGKWEPETFEVLEYFCKQSNTFVDIGAWNGVCSLYASALGCEVEIVEPDKAIAPTLEANVYANLKAYNIWDIAISDSNGEAVLKSQSKFGDSMSSLVDRSNEKGFEAVSTVTLESFIDQCMIDIKNVCLMKMDIEGGEVLVLKQSQNFLKTYRPTIWLSLHPAWFPDGVLQTIIDIIFPIYSVCRLIDGIPVQYSRKEFLKLVGEGIHSFVLIGK